jgi:hypothetical protein
MAIIGKKIQSGGNECLVPVVIQRVDDAPVLLEACVRVRHQFLDESSGRKEQIRKTQDPQERQKLLRQHRATMQSAMTIMHGMWGPGMMGHGTDPGMMGGAGPGMMGGWGHMGGYSHLTPEQRRQRQYITDQFLRMQQEMMNNMMWQQQYRMGPPPAGTQ